MTVIEVHGSVRILDQELVERWMDAAAADAGSTTLVDLSDLDPVWAVTVAVLVVGYCRSHRCGDNVGIVVAQPGMAETLCRHGLSEVVSVYLSAGEAAVALAADSEHMESAPLEGSRIDVRDARDERTAKVRVGQPRRRQPKSAVPELSPGRHRS